MPIFPSAVSARMRRSTIGFALVATGVASGGIGHAQTPATAPTTGAQETASPAAPTAEATPEVATPAPIASQVRIVRLSQVHGRALLDRNTGRGFEPAFANIPIVAGAALRTEGGVAEVEFEDNSSLRLAPDSEVRFGNLSRMTSGGTVTEVNIVKGLVYADVQKTNGNLFTLTDGATHVTVTPGTHVRLDATQATGKLAVFDGHAEVAANGTATVVNKRETAEISRTENASTASTRHGLDEGAYDEWDKQESGYHRQKAGLASSGGFGLFGANDLNYYGSFNNVGGCGSLWRPYFASAAWDPFASGVWTWYPNAGYSWVSPYPWGWLPFHSGSWVSCGGAGWGWRPAGQWYGLNNTVAMRIARHPIHPMPVPPAPRSGSTLVGVNMTHITASSGSTTEAFTFRRDSAGLGVPRSTFGNLRGLSSNTERHGVATSSIMAPAFHGGNPAVLSHAGVGGRSSNASVSTSRASSVSSNAGSARGGSYSAPAAGSSMSAPSGGAATGGGGHK